MKLFYTPLSGYVHRIEIVARETGLWDNLTLVPTNPFDSPEELVAANPLSKVPTLALDSGVALYGGPVIYEYLDSVSHGPKLFLPAGTEQRFIDMTRMALGEWMFDLTNIRSFEIRRVAEHIDTDYAERMRKQIARAIAKVAEDCDSYTGFTIGQICIACGLHYQLWLINRGRDIEDWRTTHPELSRWYDRFTDRPSFVPRDHEVPNV